jgi:hypothetical protein
MRAYSAGLLLLVMTSATMFGDGDGIDAKKISDYLKTLPAVTAPAFTEERKEMLAAFAISCADRPQESPGTRNNYLWGYEKMPQLLENYDRNRAFFGCANWHDAVGSTWTMMTLMRQDAKISLASDIKDIATTHFRKTNVDGEVAFFSAPKPPNPGGGGNINFEEPYGYSWLLKLYGETKGGNFADGKKLATALAPLAKFMSEHYVYYLYNLKFPYRSGTDTNTAWAMNLALDGVNLSEDTTLQTAIHANALRLFGKDKNCPTGLEPQNADNVSSCLTEAALMGRVMEQQEYLKWLDAFLPPVYSEGFQGYAKEIDTSHTSTAGPDAQMQLNAKSHLIALNFQRAYGLLVISYALPKDDPRIPVLKTLAAINAKHGYDQIDSAGYEGQHWLATYAMLYENAAKGPAPLEPEKPKGRPDRQGQETSESSPDGN